MFVYTWTTHIFVHVYSKNIGMYMCIHVFIHPYWGLSVANACMTINESQSGILSQ